MWQISINTIMTTLTPVISSDYNANTAAIANNYSYLPVNNTERPLFAVATFDVSSPPLVGQEGATFIDDTVVYNNTRGWFALQILEDTIFDSLVGNWDQQPTNYTFTRDHVLYGKFTSIQLQSGAILAYKL